MNKVFTDSTSGLLMDGTVSTSMTDFLPGDGVEAGLLGQQVGLNWVLGGCHFLRKHMPSSTKTMTASSQVTAKKVCEH